MRKHLIAAVVVVSLATAACGTGADAGAPGTTSPATTTVVETTSVTATTAPVGTAAETGYTIPDTGQTACYDEAAAIACPEEGEAFFGQDGSYAGARPSFVGNGDGTVTDLVTGLMWQQDPGEKQTYAEAAAGADSFSLAGYDDWRLPTIDELYSLIDFGGTDPSACRTDDGCGATPFIDDVFAFSYGDVADGERLIDSQWATSTIYEGTTMGGATTMFGVNFADGRIKGYPVGATGPDGSEKEYFVVYVRGGEGYGANRFVDNGDGTVTDLATLLTWQQDDSGVGMEWEEALASCEALELGGFDDWRLPNAKELQDLVDYERGPQSTASAAIDPVFEATQITDEGGSINWGFYWSGTTHASVQGGSSAVYVAFGEALGFMTGPQGGEPTLMDVHGAGAQRSDPKTGDAADYATGHGPQGDVVRIDNLVRCVRGGETETVTGGEVEASAAAPAAGAAPGGPLADAAAALGITEAELVTALGDPSSGPPDLEEAARHLGIPVDHLRAVLPPPPEG